MHRLLHSPLLRGQRHRFLIGMVALFLAILGLASIQGYADASSDRLFFGSAPNSGTVPNGTVPPGTIPPGPGPVLSGLVNVIHAAPIDSDINNTGVDICDAETNAKIGGPLLYGEQSGYQEYRMDDYAWFVAPAGDDCASNLHDITPFTIYGGTTLSIVIYGGANGYPLTSVVIAGDEGSRIQLMPIMQHEQ